MAVLRAQRQRGVAVITALLLTTLAITIVASLFWQQQVQVRSMENQRLQLQTKWILRGALDWARLILREDGRLTAADRLDEPWAVPLAETRLDEYVDKGANPGANAADAGDAVLSGQIIDAQSRYNLANLAQTGRINPVEVAALGRLLKNLRLKPELAKTIAEAMALAQPQPAGAAPGPTAGTPVNVVAGAALSAAQPLAMTQVDDLLAVPGFSAATLAVLRDYVVILPQATAVNVNTAPVEVLAARIDGLSLSDAGALVTGRERLAFKDLADFRLRLPEKARDLPQGDIDIKTSYFIIYGKVRLDRASQEMQALVERRIKGSTQVIWIREN